MLDLSRLKQKLIGVHLNARGLETNRDFDSAGSRARVEIKERMLVTTQFPFHLLQEFFGGNRLGAERRGSLATHYEAPERLPASRSPRSSISRRAFSNAESDVLSKSTK